MPTLIQAGASAHAVDRFGYTPLRDAVIHACAAADAAAKAGEATPASDGTIELFLKVGVSMRMRAAAG